MDMMRIYQICFRVGVLFTVVSFILGQLVDFMDFDGDINLEGDVPGVAVSPLKPVVITAFITVFGGVGIMALNKGVNNISTFIISIIIGFIVASLLFKLVIVPLHKAQSTSAVSQQKLVGHIAKVDIGMEGNSFGKIAYNFGGNTYTAPSKSEDGQSIGRGERVIIASIKDNIFFVNKIQTDEDVNLN